MKLHTKIIFIALTALFLASCQHKNTTDVTTRSSEKASEISSISSESQSINKTTSQSTAENSTPKDTLHNQYSDEEIEYARVWLTVVGDYMLNEADSQLHVEQIAKGTPIFPDLSETAVYDQDVTKLSGSRSIDHIIVYASNHDGTIELYKFPTKWSSTNVKADDKEAVDTYTETVVKATTTTTIQTEDPLQVTKMIELIK